jgi:hypothetical protein
MSTLEKVELEISSNCNCRYCDACGLGGEDVACPECANETRFMEYCDGACYEYKIQDLEEYLIPAYMSANGEPDYLRIEGKRMGWQARSGYKVIKATHKELWDSLTLSGDWTLRYVLEGDSLTVTRYSHDEPMGASFTITPDKGEDMEE